MMPEQFNQLLNTPKIEVPQLPKSKTLNFGAILFAGISVVTIIYAVHLYRQNEELMAQIKD